MKPILEHALQQLRDLANALDFLHEASGPGLKPILFDLSARASMLAEEMEEAMTKAGGAE